MNLNIGELHKDSSAVVPPVVPDGTAVPTELEPGTPALEQIAGTEQTNLISDEVQALLIAQIGHEMFAHYEYTAISCWFHAQALEGFAAWATKQSCDEVAHAKKIINFLVELDINPVLPIIDAASAQFEDVASAVAAIMMREKGVTENWKDIGKQAMNDQDLATLNLSQWFINEQMEEENLVKTILQKVEMAGGGAGLLVLDGQLKEKYS